MTRDVTVSKVRRPVVAVALVAALLVVTQVFLRAPAAIVYRGAALGMVTALLAAGLVLIYRTIRVINFAQVAMGFGGATLTLGFVQYTDVPFLPAFLLGLVLSGLVGALIGILALRMFNAPRLVATVFTVALAALSGVVSIYVLRLPFFPNVETLAAFEQLGAGGFADRLPLAGLEYRIGGLPLPLGFKEILALEVGALGLLGVGAFFRYTRAGTAVRAISENAERASLLGIGVGSLSILVWAIAGVLSGAAVTLSGMLVSPQLAATGGNPAALIPALTAAVVGRMRSLPVAAGAAVGLSVLGQAWDYRLPDDRPLFNVVLLVVITVTLVIQRKGIVRSEQREETSSWVSAQEPRPIPAELIALPGVRVTRWALIGVGIIAVAIYPYAFGSGAVVLGSVIAINAIVVLSLVVLTGWAGQVSLGQFGFVAVGAVIAGALATNVNVPFLVTVPVTVLIVAGFAAIVGLPALRVPGLFLLPVSFAFAAAVRAVLFDERYFSWLLPDTVERPVFLLLDFEDERSMYYLSVAALVLAILVVVTLRRSRVGRLLIALRENEANVRSFGVSAVRTRLLAFGVAGGLAGFAGAIFAYQQRGASAGSFPPERGLFVFIEAAFGGVASITGAFLGSAYFRIQEYLGFAPIIMILTGPLVAVALLYAAPGGLISLLIRARDGVLKIVAQRRQIIVPSLFADIDPETLRRRLWPLAEGFRSMGLAVLPRDKRFRLASELYGEDGSSTDGRDRQQPLPATSVTESGSR